MASQEEQPDWLDLPSDLVTIIARRSRDAVTGLAAFRSVCRAWRAAAGPAPRLLLPRVRASHTAVFPLSRGWSLVVDTHDASCHVSHLATRATAALPKLNAVRDGPGSDVVRHVRYVHRNDLDTALCSNWIFPTYLDFTDYLRFALHLPPGAPAAVATGMTVMMYHKMHGHTGMLFCRPGDAAWTKVEKPRRIGYGYFDFAYHDGKVFGMDINGEMAVFDAATLGALQLVPRPPDMPNLSSKMYDSICSRKQELDYVHLVALPSKLVLVVARTTVKSSRPVALDLFELGSSPAPDGQLAWRKVAEAGNYELFVDRYHATFRENDGANGTRIYYVHDMKKVSTVAAYCYSMQENKLECVYRSPEDDGPPDCLTRPSWFVP
ncbi:F-box protein At2g26160-like [Aegilops tauschii subsp. strangulata]